MRIVTLKMIGKNMAKNDNNDDNCNGNSDDDNYDNQGEY